jgi:hypothetical protein
MDIDPSIYFIIVVPDAAPEKATPMQGFALSLCMNSGLVRVAALLPNNIYDLTEEGRDTLLIRRMSGAFPVHWYAQSPKAIRAIPYPPFVPFSLVVLPDSESPSDYEAWADTSPLRPTIVAREGGDLTFADLSIEGLQAQFLKVCDRIPESVDPASIEDARRVLKSWKQPPGRKLDYQVGGHNSVAPNLAALQTAGFEDLIYGPFKDLKGGTKPYVDQIVRTAHSIFDERDAVGDRGLHQIYRKPPDLNLFAPAIYPDFFDLPIPAALDKDEMKRTRLARQALMRQSGYNFEIRTEAQQKAMLGEITKSKDGKPETDPNPLMLLRARELSLSTELMGAIAASEFSAVVRLPNEVNRTLGGVRNFSEHYRSHQPTTRKRLLAFRQVQDRLASAVPSEFLDLIRRSKTGVRVVSDAHLEWLNVDGLPLAVRKDCSRIPVTPGNLFVDHLAARPIIRLTPNDFQSVLVISALTRDDPIRGLFESAFDTFEPRWRDHLTVTFVEVKSAAELVKALNEFNGPMVVFDGHGGHAKNKPAQVYLGSEAVDVWGLRDQIQNMPPILVLSACDTHAADRNHATTANGFMHLGARTVLSSVFPLEARTAAAFAARLVYRVAAFLLPAIELFGEALTWTEVMSGMLRMQLLTDFLRQLLQKNKINQAMYDGIHVYGSQAINGRNLDPFVVVMSRLEQEAGLTRKSLELELELAVANSSVISYLQVGRPETILIDTQERIQKHMKEIQQAE